MSKAKSNRKVYIYDDDWDDISEYFAMIRGRSTLTKTAAIREVIHQWTEKQIRPKLRAANTASAQPEIPTLEP